VGLPLCKGLASSATKNANPESEEGFDEICQTQKRKRSSRVSETQRKEKSSLPLRKVKGLVSSASKETLDCSKVLDSLTAMRATSTSLLLILWLIICRQSSISVGFLRPNGKKPRRICQRLLVLLLCPNGDQMARASLLFHQSLT
ncbi:unnamed protein product, partial [Prunus brigantina]